MSLYHFGPFQLDAERLLLLDRGEPIPIGPKVVETLLALVEHPGELFAKSALLARIWPEGYVDEANLAQNIYVLRKTLRSRWNAEAIETIPRRGYRFIAPVQRRDDAPRPRAGARALSAAGARVRRIAAGRRPQPSASLSRRRRHSRSRSPAVPARARGSPPKARASTRSAATIGTCARATASRRASITSRASSTPIRTTPAGTPGSHRPTP